MKINKLVIYFVFLWLFFNFSKNCFNNFCSSWVSLLVTDCTSSSVMLFMLFSETFDLQYSSLCVFLSFRKISEPNITVEFFIFSSFIDSSTPNWICFVSFLSMLTISSLSFLFKKFLTSHFIHHFLNLEEIKDNTIRRRWGNKIEIIHRNISNLLDIQTFSFFHFLITTRVSKEITSFN